MWEAVQRSCCARKGAIYCSKALKTRAVALETQTEQFAKHFGALQALAKLNTSSGAFLLPENPGINGQLICEPAGKDVLMRRARGWAQLSAVQGYRAGAQEHFNGGECYSTKAILCGFRAAHLSQPVC